MHHARPNPPLHYTEAARARLVRCADRAAEHHDPAVYVGLVGEAQVDVWVRRARVHLAVLLEQPIRSHGARVPTPEVQVAVPREIAESRGNDPSCPQARPRQARGGKMGPRAARRRRR